MPIERLISHLEKLVRVKREEPMALHTTFHIGGPAEAYLEVHTCEELRSVLDVVKEWEVSTFLMGAGSNLLVDDSGIAGLVIETWNNKDVPNEHFYRERGDADGQWRVHAFCGTPLPRVARQTAHAGMAGLEWAVGIPGTIGGGIVNNAGAHGGSMADLVEAVHVWTHDGERALAKKDLDFSYRNSNFRSAWAGCQHGPVVLSAELLLTPEDPAQVKARMEEHTAYRKSTQPSQRSVGSIFKNPEGYAAGWLVEQVGLKGTRIGDAQVSPKHGNFIVNRGRATAADVRALMEMVQERVEASFEIRLEPEIQQTAMRKR